MFFAAMQAGPGPADDFWYEPIRRAAAAGAYQTDAAMRQNVVFACVSLLAQSVAKIPTRVMSGIANVERTHSVTRLLIRRPNRWQTAFEYKEMLQAHLCLRSNAYSQKIFDPRTGELTELIPLHPDRVRIEQTAEDDFLYVVRDWRGIERRLLPFEVWHIRGLSLDGFSGLSTVSAQADVIGTALSSQGQRNRSFESGPRHAGMWVKMPGKFENDEARRKFATAFRQSMSGSNAFSVPVMDRGMELHALGMTNADAQMIESAKLSETEICRLWLIPPHMVGILDRATNNNIEQQNEQFYSVTLMALFRRWEESAEVNLLDEIEQDTLRVEFDVPQLLRADTTVRGALYHNAIQDGWMTRNEVRKREGLEPIEGLDEPMEPLNMARSNERSTENNAPADAMLLAAADRVVRRECNAIKRIQPGAAAREQVAAFYEKHAPWMAAVMGIDRSVADRVCIARFDELLASQAPVASLMADWQDLGGAHLLDMMKALK